MDLKTLNKIYWAYYHALMEDITTTKYNNPDLIKEHIKRFWLNVISIKSYDLVSKMALNKVFVKVLKEFGIKKSVDFSDPVKEMYRTCDFWFEGLELKMREEL